jgi:hypothetical protein
VTGDNVCSLALCDFNADGQYEVCMLQMYFDHSTQCFIRSRLPTSLMIVSCMAANGTVICSPKKSSTDHDCKAHWPGTFVKCAI